MKIELSDKAQLALDNIVKILDGNHSLLHEILKSITEQNKLMVKSQEQYQKGFDMSESFMKTLNKMMGKPDN